MAKRIIRIACELFGIIIMAFIVFIPHTLQVDIIWPQIAYSLYAALTRFLFVFGLTLTILPSLLGCKRSLVIFLMDTNLFNFIAKISFCTYLVHLTVLLIFYKSRTYDRYYSEFPIIS
jgi:peptidoglycan/LPS O-acetylase OafA/YrhL